MSTKTKAQLEAENKAFKEQVKELVLKVEALENKEDVKASGDLPFVGMGVSCQPIADHDGKNRFVFQIDEFVYNPETKEVVYVRSKQPTHLPKDLAMTEHGARVHLGK
jgi:hypothetical protein